MRQFLMRNGKALASDGFFAVEEWVRLDRPRSPAHLLGPVPGAVPASLQDLQRPCGRAWSRAAEPGCGHEAARSRPTGSLSWIGEPKSVG